MTVGELMEELKHYDKNVVVKLGVEGHDETKKSWLGVECKLTEIIASEKEIALYSDDLSDHYENIHNE